jgi:hypothetical protein
VKLKRERLLKSAKPIFSEGCLGIKSPYQKPEPNRNITDPGRLKFETAACLSYPEIKHE